MTISSSIMNQMQSSSWIRKMFETGRALKQRYGAENVFDLSLGSPMLDPPEEFKRALQEIVNTAEPGMHRYMPNPGYPSTRAAFAGHISTQEEVEVAADDITVTVEQDEESMGELIDKVAYVNDQLARLLTQMATITGLELDIGEHDEHDD